MFLIGILCVAVGDPCVVCVWPQNKVVRGLTCWHDGRSVWLSLCSLGNMPRLFYVCFVSGTMCWRLCDCRVEGEAWRELRERRGQELRLVSRRGGHCPPNAALLLSAHTLTLQHCSRRHQHAARQRMPPPPRVRPEGDASAVAFRGGTSCGTAACPKSSRRARTRHRALAAECLRRGGHCGGVPPHSMLTDA
ncbi:hypothetical protein TcCL_NonESM07901 [Trypanosoma cruzi]|nr:hypothetical protein TcCL_NonESM07901 [Trypanosoma cruzi]